MNRVLDMAHLRFRTWEKLGPGYPMLLQQSTIFFGDENAISKRGEYGNVEKSRQRRSRPFAVLTYYEYAPLVKMAAALLDELF